MRLTGLMPNVGRHLRGVVSGREAAVGLRNQWTLGEGIRLHTEFEQIRSLNGADRTTTALTGAVEYTTNPDWKGSARLEYRTDVSSNQLLGTLGMAYRDSVDNRWDALGRYEFKHEDDNTSAAITQRSAHILSTHASYQPRTDLSFSGRYAGKHVLENSSGINSSYSAHLLSARADYDIARDWTVGVNAGVLFSAGMRSRQGALGAELGRVLTKNLWLSVGYNHFGFRDDDLAPGGFTDKGVFLRLRYTFDENLLN